MHRAVPTVLADPGASGVSWFTPGAASTYSSSNEVWYLAVVGHSGGIQEEGVGGFRRKGEWQ
jgi:hypothetical protein